LPRHTVSTLRDAEVLDRARQRKAVGRDDADVALEVHEAALVEVLGVHHRRVHVGEDLEFVGAPDVIAIARRAVAHQLAAIGGVAHLSGLERLDHGVLLGHAPDPLVALDAHVVVTVREERDFMGIRGR
jgi:hypothetical protein